MKQLPWPGNASVQVLVSSHVGHGSDAAPQLRRQRCVQVHLVMS